MNSRITPILVCKECSYERDPHARMPSDGALICPNCGAADEWGEHYYDNETGLTMNSYEFKCLDQITKR